MQICFHYEKQHDFITSVVNIILISIILATDSTIGCVMSNTWCQMVWHLIVGAGPHTHPVLWDADTSWAPTTPLPTRRCGPIAVGKQVVEGTT